MMFSFLLYIFLYLILSMAQYSHAQVWDENFYDSQILFDNVELLQMTEHEINLIKIRNMKKQFKINQTQIHNNKHQIFIDMNNSELSEEPAKKTISFKNVSEIVENRQNEKN